MKTPARNSDLAKVDTHLSATEKQECRLAGLRQKEIAALGERYTCHASKAPARGTYNALTGARLA
jgi:hypothetical protein